MSVYGKSKRKLPFKNNKTLLSPTKYKDLDELDEFCSQSSSIIASSLFSGTSDSIDISSDTAFEEELTMSEHSGPTSTIFQNRSNSNLNSVFSCFENLEYQEYKSVKTMKLDNSLFAKKTTLFKTDNDLDPDVATVSDSGLSKQVYENVSTLHQRISELEANASQRRENIEKLKSTSQSIHDGQIKHYGGSVRSFKMSNKNLSEEEDEEEKEEEHHHFYESDTQEKRVIGNLVHCKSLYDLKVKDNEKTNKLDFEMIVEQVNRLENSKYELLEVTIDLLIRMRTSSSFSKYLKEECNQIDKLGYNTIKKLVSQNSESLLFSLLLLIHLEINGIDANHIVGNLLPILDISVTKYVENMLIPKSKKLLHCLLSDWSSEYTGESICGLLLNSLLKTSPCYFSKLSDNNRLAVMDLLESCLISTSPKILLDCFRYLKSVICSINSNDIKSTVSILSRCIRTVDPSDIKVFNSLLEVVIVLVCNQEDSSITEHLLSAKNWGKIWAVINDANMFGRDDKLEVEKEKQVLLAVGFAFSFLDSDSNLREYDITPVRQILELCCNNSKYSTLKYHCIGYIICIAFHFFEKFDLLNDGDSLLIKRMCVLLQKSGFEFENKVGTRIHAIMNYYELVNV